MKRILVLAAICLVSVARQAWGEALPNWIPWPQTARLSGGAMRLPNPGTVAFDDPKLEPLAKVLGEELHRLTGLPWTSRPGAGQAGQIALQLDRSLEKEAYSLTVAQQATVRGGSYAAVALGTATVLQALAGQAPDYQLPAMSVQDQPASAFRGLMIDVARQWHSLENLKQCVVLCRLYKIRYLQLHLTDGEAWTFPSRAFPKLTTKNYHNGRVCTLEELKELVAFADQRGVTIIPELETPGHGGAAARTMPEIFDALDPATGKAVGTGCMNMANDRLYPALETILGEVAEVFASSPYIHIGCDEVWLGEIHRAPQYAETLARLGLKDGTDLFYRHITLLNDMVRKLGKTTLVWEGFHNEGNSRFKIPKDIIVMAFENTYNPADNLAQHGYQMINTAWTPLYVTMGVRQAPEHIYNWNLFEFGRFTKDYAAAFWVRIPPTPLVIGAQVCSWEQPEWAELPSLRDRLPAMSERVWNPDAKRSWADFQRRSVATDRLLARLILPVTIHADGLLAPNPERSRDVPTPGLGYDEYLFNDTLTVRLKTAPPTGAEEVIHYTLDGTEPGEQSPVYGQPLVITKAQAKEASPNANHPPVLQVTVKARLFEGHQPVGYTVTQFYRHNYLAAKPKRYQYTVYQVPAKTARLPEDLSKLLKVKSGWAPWANLRGLPEVNFPRSYAAVFERDVKLPAGGDYEFQLRSEGGTSQLLLDGKVVVDRTKTDWDETVGKVSLPAGPHTLKVIYVGSGDFMSLHYRTVGQKEWKSVDDTLEAAPRQKEVRTHTNIPAQKVAQAAPTPGRSAEVSGSHENPNQEFGKDAHYQLTGDTTFGWRTGPQAGDIALNGHALVMETGGGNYTVFSGAISGPGSVEWRGGGVPQVGPSILAGDKANSFRGPFTLTRGVLDLDKPAGVDAISGDLIVGATGSAVVRLKKSDQINDAAHVTLGGSGISGLELQGHHENFASLTLETHAEIVMGDPPAALVVGDSSARSWDLTKTLTIRGFKPGQNKVSFGKDSQGLNPAQLARIGFASPAGMAGSLYTAKIGPDGALAPDAVVKPVNPPFDVSPQAAAERAKFYDKPGLASLTGQGSPLKDGMTLVFFGDSITWQNGFVGAIEQALKTGEGTQGKSIKLVNRGINGGGVVQVRDGVTNSAFPGNSAQKPFAELIAADKADLAVVFIGINDVWWRNTTPDVFAKALRDLVASAKANRTSVVLATLSLHGELPDGKNGDDPKIEQYAELTRHVAQDTTTTLVDLRKAYVAYLQNHNAQLRVDGTLYFMPSGVLTYDGVHPSGKGVTLLANLISDGLFRALGGPRP